MKIFGYLVLLGLVATFGSFELYKYFNNSERTQQTQEHKTKQLSELSRTQKIKKRENNRLKEEKLELYLGAEREEVNFKELSLEKSRSENFDTTRFQQGAGTPAQYVLGESRLGLGEISYELNSVNFTNNGFIKLFWKIRNNTSQAIVLNENLRQALNPSKAVIIDRKVQRVFNVVQDDLLMEPVANCMLTETIPAYGRIECSAKLVNLSFNTPRNINQQAQGNQILIYLPGVKKPIKVFRELLV